MKKYKFTIRGNDYNVHLKDIEDNIAELEVNGTLYEVKIHGEVKTTKTPQLVRKPIKNKPGEGKIKKAAATTGDTLKVTAPLPGTILKINVGVGDAVTEGQTLMIMEAMKMENQINTSKAGTISAIKVGVGDSVLQDDVLVEIS